MTWGRKRLAELVGALLLAGPALAAAQTAPQPRAPSVVQQQGEPRPAIWLLSDDDTRIYLFGTVHILHPDLRWRSATFDRVAREAQELVLELTDEQMSAGVMDAMPMMMMMGKTVPLLQRVSPARRETLARMLRDLNLADGSLDQMETWAVALILGVGQMARDYVGGAATESGGTGTGEAQNDFAALPGVEEALTREFRANGRPISGVETANDQIAAFRIIPLSVQQAMLDEAVDAYGGDAEASDPNETNWINGDLDGIAAEMEGLPPELYESLITRRNRNFADWLVRRLDRPGTVLFAIGAGHLAGRVSVQSMLESRGLRVQRIY
jgi:uncharacterized protein YbaP (TraB family)